MKIMIDVGLAKVVFDMEVKDIEEFLRMLIKIVNENAKK